MTFKPGQSGNPNGRPKGTTKDKSITFKALTLAAKELLAQVQPSGRETNAEFVARNWVERAAKNPGFLALLLDRTEGKLAGPEQPTTVYDNSRHLSVTVLGDSRLREMAIALQRALEAGVEAQGTLRQALEVSVAGSDTQEASGEDAQEE